MKKIWIALIVALVFVLTTQAQDKKNNQVEGNGKMVTKEVTVTSFDGLKASGIFELVLLQGDKESVKIVADENLQDLFDVHLDGSRLILDMKRTAHIRLNSKNQMKVYVTFKKLKDIELNTVGHVVCDQSLTFDELVVKNKNIGNVDLHITANKLDLFNTSIGNLKLSGMAKDAQVKNSGVGAIRAGNFIVQAMNIENTGVGNVEVNAIKNLKVKDSFLGKVTNKGMAPVRKMNKVRV